MIWGRDDTGFEALFVFTLNPRIWQGEGPGYLEALDRVALPESFAEPFFLTVPDVLAGRSLQPKEQAEAVAVWNAEAGDEQARCHIPRHGLGTVRNGAFDWLASICFECANVFIGGTAATADHRIIGWSSTDLEKCLTGLLKA